MTTNQWTETMTTFFSQQSDRSRRVRQMTNANALQTHVTNCTTKLHSHVHEARKIWCNHFQRALQEHVNEWSFYTREALPLSQAKVFRLAHISPIVARSPARRSSDGREPSGKTSGEMSRVMSAQRPGNGRSVAAAMPPSVRQDGLQDNLCHAGVGHVMVAPETCETTRNLAVQQPCRSPRNGQGNISQAARGNSVVSF